MNPTYKQLQSQSLSTLLSLIDDTFASCDDLFFDLASRASSNIEQNFYFESMREIRIRSQHCRTLFEKSFIAHFETLESNHKSDSEKNDQELSLIDDDEMELKVAKTAMENRSRTASKRYFFEFHTRFKTLMNKELEEEVNPLSPDILISLFIQSISDIEIKIKARIILLKQYERLVLNRLNEILINANKLLEKSGIKFVRPKSKAKGKQSYTGASTNDIGEQENLLNNIDSIYQYARPELSELSSLLSRLRGSELPYTNPLLNRPLFSLKGDYQLPSEELLHLLDNNSFNELASTENIDLRSYISSLIKNVNKDSGRSAGVKQIDEDVINLVAMFFDFVLEDENIPAVIKALLSRLQMSVLKVALKDKRFFTDEEHSARNFINEISRISIGLDDTSTASNDLLEQLEEWVLAIQNSTEDPDEAFKEASESLAKYNEKANKKAELVEKRTNENASGLAAKQIATMKTQKAIQEAMDGKVLATSISEFIINIWQQVLYRAVITEGDDSQVWLSNLQAMQDLIWCSQPHEDDKSRSRYQRIQPELINKLAHGMENSNLNDVQMKATLADIKQTLDSLHSSATKPEANAIEIKTIDIEQDKRLETIKEQKNWKEMSALERQKAQHEALTYEFIERADAIETGTWLEFKVPSSGTVTRCKLATKIKESDTYIFVNRLGFKAVEKTRKDFAFDLQRKRARILKSGLLFDRSLHKLVSSLKGSK